MSKSSPARAQRRLGAKQPVAQQQPAPRVPHDEAFLRRVQAMISGQEPPPNEYVTYQLGQLKEAQAEFEAMQRNVQNAESQIAQMRIELQRADGRMDARLRDIRVWCDKKDETAEAPEEEAAPPTPVRAPVAAAN